MKEEKLALNIAEAASMIGVSHPVMLALVRENDCPAFKVGRRWLIPKVSLEQWVIECAKEHRVIKTKDVEEDES